MPCCPLPPPPPGLSEYGLYLTAPQFLWPDPIGPPAPATWLRFSGEPPLALWAPPCVLLLLYIVSVVREEGRWAWRRSGRGVQIQPPRGLGGAKCAHLTRGAAGWIHAPVASMRARSSAVISSSDPSMASRLETSPTPPPLLNSGLREYIDAGQVHTPPQQDGGDSNQQPLPPGLDDGETPSMHHPPRSLPPPSQPTGLRCEPRVVLNIQEVRTRPTSSPAKSGLLRGHVPRALGRGAACHPASPDSRASLTPCWGSSHDWRGISFPPNQALWELPPQIFQRHPAPDVWNACPGKLGERT